MLKYALALAVAPLMASPAFAQVQIDAQGPVVSLAITENVAVDPDIANLSAGVTTLEPTAVAASQANARQMERLVREIERLGIARRDIQTSGISLNAEYTYAGPENQPTFRGYRATNRVNITVRDIDDVGRILDSMVAAGANDIGGIGWSVDDSTAALDRARSTAFTNGREQAMEYARMAGFSDVRLLQVSENVFPNRPMYYGETIAVTASDIGEARTPTAPGQVNVGVTVNFSYEMVR